MRNFKLGLGEKKLVKLKLFQLYRVDLDNESTRFSTPVKTVTVDRDMYLYGCAKCNWERGEMAERVKRFPPDRCSTQNGVTNISPEGTTLIGLIWSLALLGDLYQEHVSTLSRGLIQGQRAPRVPLATQDLSIDLPPISHCFNLNTQAKDIRAIWWVEKDGESSLGFARTGQDGSGTAQKPGKLQLTPLATSLLKQTSNPRWAQLELANLLS